MKGSLYALIIIFFGSCIGLQAQNVQLFAEDFNTGANPFVLNDTVDTTYVPVGPNKWIINSSYSGGAIYPNTIRQDSTVAGGTIAGAPFSRYLHIHDAQAAPAVSNANFNPAVASDNFAVLSAPICTKAISDVKISFFYLCEGNANAYGELYYSRNGGPWIKTGATKYQGQGKWKYEVVQNTAFDDVDALRFAFRWVNTAGATPKSTSFSVDDIIVVGTYDPQIHPLNIDVTLLIPDPVCRGSNLFVFYELSDSVCAGTYRFWLSEPGGSFNSPTSLGVLTINSSHRTFAVAVSIPTTAVEDTCYKIRVDRISPIPTITGTVSICFEVIDCPNIITTRQPVVTMDPDTVCVGSVIDVPFNSTGVYNQNNVYTAQLSDTNGSFANPFILGSSPDPKAYPAIPPGSVGGLIPNNVPPGCGYFIRVISSSPPAIGSLYGPICIRDCDITTNKQQDISVCINESNGAEDSIYVDVHSWNTNAQYYLGNEFAVEVHNSMNFGLVNIGGLGATFDTTNTRFLITIPPLPGLLGLGMIPGMYYIRIVADNTSTPYDSMGTLVRLTIGAPSENPANVFPIDSFICTGDVGGFFFVPYNSKSTYEWQSANLNNGQPFTWPGNQLLINFSGFAGALRARVREINYGCYGPWSGYSELGVLTPPDVGISGDIKVCLHDTILYKVPFQTETYYEWDPPTASTVIDTTNNEARLTWDSIGTFLISIRALNKCGLDFGYKEVTVYDHPMVELGPDITVCEGEEVVLGADGNQGDVYWLKGQAVAAHRDTFRVTPTEPVTYFVYVSNPGCATRDTISIDVEQPQSTQDSLELCKGETVDLDAGVPGISYEWNTGDSTQVITVGESGDYNVILLDPSKACDNERRVNVVVNLCGYILDIPNAFTPNGDNLNDEFGILGDNYELNYFRIYNRWGELVFESTTKGQAWDGTYKGENADQGVYTWVVSFTYEGKPQDILSGNVTLLR